MTWIIMGAVLLLAIILFFTHGEWVMTKCDCNKNKKCSKCNGAGSYYVWHHKK